MKTIRKTVVLGLLIILNVHVKADEGMWLLSMLEGYTIEDMQANGFKLTADDIYSINDACLKDAVVIFGGGCTGVLISNKGLLLTNHHCGYSRIQSHSTVEQDYLTDGFWAMSRQEELPNRGLSVRFLRYMKDVTEMVKAGIKEDMKKETVAYIIGANSRDIQIEAEASGNYTAEVVPMFYGNQYFLFVYEIYKDVRLVGAPPSSIGNFGQDTDNWMWPRHTGDFSLFRVYADSDNNPAEYSIENVPYKPRKSLEISMDGVQKGDFTMILGYPGSTQQFLYSEAIKTMMETTLPLRIALRTKRMDIMDKYMLASDQVRIQYSSKFRDVSNAWKKWQGAIRGLERLDAVNKKEKFEESFAEWVSESDAREEKYATILRQFEEIYTQLKEYQVMSDLIGEAVFAVEIVQIASRVNRMMEDSVAADDILKRMRSTYKDYYAPLDKEMFAAMLKEYHTHGFDQYDPEFFAKVEKKFKGDFDEYVVNAFDKSPLEDSVELADFLKLYEKNYSKAIKKLQKDPLVEAMDQFRDIYLLRIAPQMQVFYSSLDELYKLWVQGNFEFKPDVRQYPDANFTMRLTYGEVKGYQPEDGVRYDYYTTLEGVIEKEKEGMHDYIIPEKLNELYEEKDFGQYGEDGKMPVCFVASNHTSGGNSGSPLLNDDGQLIGLNFDRNWHGTMSDEMYDPSVCRNIAVDIRYVLFIIDKFAGAGNLLDEMVLVSDQ